MRQYLNLLSKIKRYGVKREGRNGNTRSIFGEQLRFDLIQGFPAITVKPLYFKTMVLETLWFLKGTGDVSFLQEHNVHIWDKWTHPTLNTVGPMYGEQLRHRINVTENVVWERDQLQDAIDLLIEKPYSRRNVMTLWDTGTVANDDDGAIANIEAGAGALALCHGVAIQLYARPLDCNEIAAYAPIDSLRRFAQVLASNHKLAYHESDKDITVRRRLKDYLFRKAKGLLYKDEIFEPSDYGVPTNGLSLMMFQRSCDVPIGLPFNIAQYALLTHMIAQVANMVPLELIISIGDAHYYLDQIKGVTEMLSRDPLHSPRLVIKRKVECIDDFVWQDFELAGYKYHPAVDLPVSA